jgi:hypothetical protein
MAVVALFVIAAITPISCRMALRQSRTARHVLFPAMLPAEIISFYYVWRQW